MSRLWLEACLSWGHLFYFVNVCQPLTPLIVKWYTTFLQGGNLSCLMMWRPENVYDDRDLLSQLLAQNQVCALLKMLSIATFDRTVSHIKVLCVPFCVKPSWPSPVISDAKAGAVELTELISPKAILCLPGALISFWIDFTTWLDDGKELTIGSFDGQ